MDKRNRTCPQCLRQFSYKVSRGADRIYCSDRCAYLSAEAKRHEKTYAECSVDGCDLDANRIGAGLCEKHYMRKRRHGSTDHLDSVKPGPLEHSGGYLLVYAPGHPLCRGSASRIYEHRKVFYDKNGEGPFSCNWCGITVTWDDMHVDHLNAVVDDNRISNLVASCPPCNVKRGVEKMRSTMRKRSNRRYTAHGLTMCLSEWSRHLGISVASIEWRMNNGWPLDKALSPRIGRSGPPSRKRSA